MLDLDNVALHEGRPGDKWVALTVVAGLALMIATALLAM